MCIVSGGDSRALFLVVGVVKKRVGLVGKGLTYDSGGVLSPPRVGRHNQHDGTVLAPNGSGLCFVTLYNWC